MYVHLNSQTNTSSLFETKEAMLQKTCKLFGSKHSHPCIGYGIQNSVLTDGIIRTAAAVELLQRTRAQYTTLVYCTQQQLADVDDDSTVLEGVESITKDLDDETQYILIPRETDS